MKTKIKEGKLFRDMLMCLFYTWGGDTPAEVFWATNDLVKWMEKEFDIKINTPDPLPEDPEDADYVDPVELILEQLGFNTEGEPLWEVGLDEKGGK